MGNKGCDILIDKSIKWWYFLSVLGRKPNLQAEILGSDAYSDIHGTASFYNTWHGVLVSTEVYGLPQTAGNGRNVFAYHIHQGSSCKSSSDGQPFALVGSHYNPQGLAHPYHSGDLPPLFSNNGYAFQIFLSNRFNINEIEGRTVIIHSNPDDFTTQPSGNPGSMIACGEIRPTYGQG